MVFDKGTLMEQENVVVEVEMRVDAGATLFVSGIPLDYKYAIVLVVPDGPARVLSVVFDVVEE